MTTQLTLEQLVLARQVFAAADPRRFLLAFKVLDATPRSNSQIKEKLWALYPAVAKVLEQWSSFGDGRLMGKMCERSLDSLGLVERTELYLQGQRHKNHAYTASGWSSSPLVNRLSGYAYFIQETAHRLGISTFLLFSHLSGNKGIEAPLNKAMIISELAAKADYRTGQPVTVGQLEGSVGLHSHLIFGHLQQLALAGVVTLDGHAQVANTGMNGKQFHYCWASNEPPPPLPPKQALVAARLYSATSKDPHALIAASEFYPGIFGKRQYARNALKRLIKAGLIEQHSKYYFQNVSPTQLGIDVAVQMVDPVIAAVRGESYAAELVRAGASSFRANERVRLLSMARSYVAASKII
ncbi:hypothetical protein HYV85_04785 [Candidatus Woesearchaeota archaeon]|nr:hypothetical protein [Candidatus Woesearchaeota archaeon]